MDNQLFPRNLTGSPAALSGAPGRFGKNLWTLSLFSLPVIYLGIILAVCIHEAIGHGLTAALLGGRFNGFGILLDGMGWANVDIASLPDLSQAFVFLGGAAATTLFSALFFALSLVFKRNPFVRLAFLFAAVTSLLDGLPYFFWDAIYLGGIGDFSMIWLLYHNSGWRVAVILWCGLWMAIAIVLFNVHYYKISYAWLGEGKPLALKSRIILSAMIFLIQALAWFSLDWDQLVPGVGSLPNLSALAVVLVTLLPLTAFYEGQGFRESWQEMPHAKTPIIAAWGVCIVLIFVIVQWLQKGIVFS